MPNRMVARPNVGGALCSTPQSLADAHYYLRFVQLSNKAYDDDDDDDDY